MALRQIKLQADIEAKKQELEALRVITTRFETREKELETAIGEAKTDEERKMLDGEIEKFTDDRSAHETSVTAAEGELERLRGDLRTLNEKAPTNKEGETRGMGGRGIEEIEEQRRSINEFVRSKGQLRDGFTSIDGGALIAEELLVPQKTPEIEVDLRKYVKTVPVNSASGKYPVITKSDGKMHTVKELEKNPELAKPTIKEIYYAIETRRGYIPISQEMIDDANYDVTGLIRDDINSQSLNTSNESISEILKTATAKAVTGIDGLKDLVNKDIKKVYPVKFIVSASLYTELDKLKDKNGRYLLQESIVTQSGKVLLGKEVVVLDDDVIGTNEGDSVGFVGDLASFMSYFDRKKTSVEWVDNNIYGKLLAGVVRYDVKKTDEAAGYYITYTNEVVTETAPKTDQKEEPETETAPKSTKK